MKRKDRDQTRESCVYSSSSPLKVNNDNMCIFMVGNNFFLAYSYEHVIDLGNAILFYLRVWRAWIIVVIPEKGSAMNEGRGELDVSEILSTNAKLWMQKIECISYPLHLHAKSWMLKIESKRQNVIEQSCRMIMCKHM